MPGCRRWLVCGTLPLGSAAGDVLAQTIGPRPTLSAGAERASPSPRFLVAMANNRRTAEVGTSGAGGRMIGLAITLVILRISRGPRSAATTTALH